MATIAEHNEARLREPMVVEIDMDLPRTYSMRSTNIQSGYKLFDVIDLDEVRYPLRVLADLQGGGFKLDGTAQLYDSTVQASGTNGKLGLRGNVGQPLVVRFTLDGAGDYADTAVTVYSSGARKIEEWTQPRNVAQPVIGREVFHLIGVDGRFVFYPENETTRVVVDAISAGAHFHIRNDNLISAQLELRSCFDDIDPKWEESTMDVSWANSADVSQLLANDLQETPITYTAGYRDSDVTSMSALRRFYIDGEITQTDGIITVKARDASHRLDGVTLPEGDILVYPGARNNSLRTGITVSRFAAALADAIDNAIGWTAVTRKSIPGTISEWKTSQYHVRPGMSLKEFIAQLHARGEAAQSGVAIPQFNYIDAGRPLLSFWSFDLENHYVRQDQISKFEIDVAPRIQKLICDDDVHLFYAYMSSNSTAVTIDDENETQAYTVYDVEPGFVFTNGYAYTNAGGAIQGTDMISWTPTKMTVKSRYTGNRKELYYVAQESGGYSSLQTANQGIELTIPPLLWGDATFRSSSDSGRYNPFDDRNRNNDSNRRYKFTWKGDPRWQPRDKIRVDMEEWGDIEGRIESISLRHEGGGTISDVTVVETRIPSTS